MAASIATLNQIQDQLMGVRTRQAAPVVKEAVMRPCAQNIVPFKWGTVFVSTGASMEIVDDISINDYSIRVEDGRLTYVSQYEYEYFDGEMMPVEVWGWPVSHEGDTIRSLGGQLPDTVAEGLYAIGLLVV